MCGCTRTLDLRNYRGVVTKDVLCGSPEVLWLGPIELRLDLVKALPVTIKTLDLDVGDHANIEPEVLFLLLRTGNLEHLRLKFRSVGILKVLEQCLPGSPLKSLQLCKNSLRDEDIDGLIPAFQSLESLNLSYNLLTDVTAHKLAAQLCNPECRLEALDIRWNKMNGDGLGAIAKSLCTNDVLEHLKLYGNNAKQVLPLYTEALQHHNTRLKKLYAEGGAETDILRHLLLLNQSGRHILKQDQNLLPSGIWPLFLKRVNSEPRQLYYYLREMPCLCNQERK